MEDKVCAEVVPLRVPGSGDDTVKKPQEVGEWRWTASRRNLCSEGGMRVLRFLRGEAAKFEA